MSFLATFTKTAALGLTPKRLAMAAKGVLSRSGLPKTTDNMEIAMKAVKKLVTKDLKNFTASNGRQPTGTFFRKPPPGAQYPLVHRKINRDNIERMVGEKLTDT